MYRKFNDKINRLLHFLKLIPVKKQLQGNHIHETSIEKLHLDFDTFLYNINKKKYKMK